MGYLCVLRALGGQFCFFTNSSRFTFSNLHLAPSANLAQNGSITVGQKFRHLLMEFIYLRIGKRPVLPLVF